MGDYIYLDNNSTTRPLESVVEAMLPLLRDEYANPSSVHRFGQEVRYKVEFAREQVAGLINAEPNEIVFTSGGTESINLANRGTLRAAIPVAHVIGASADRLCNTSNIGLERLQSEPILILRKHSQSNRSDRGVTTQAALMSIYRTLRLRGHDPLHPLADALRTYLQNGQLPPLPPATPADG